MRTQRLRRWTHLALAAALTVALAGCGAPADDVAHPDSGAAPASPVATASTGPPSSSTPAPTRTRSVPPTPDPAPTTTPAGPSRTVSPEPTTLAPSSASTTPAQPPTPTQTPTTARRTTLQIGDRGEKVLHLQQQLSDLGYWLGEPDGHFGGLTQQAVFALQKAAGITRDGVVGPQTTAALSAGTRPTTRVGATGVEIDLGRQLLLLVRDGHVVRVLNTSTGNGEEYVSQGTRKIARTPTGSFAVYRMVDALEVAELGELYRPMYFYGGYAVHGSPSIPPYPASHGCARVSNSAMNMLWSSGDVGMGTTVTVYR